ncbi:HAD superfamily hydrolase [Rahnella aquatilis CIP 78.65 = ATCC 33071]|uniref:Putative hydrolase or acyltransferase of alpha/beta superfamily n=1 Tax=Rahnella aquatilis (strain ATCC 33071 / DSM 4594 / JCM 1683 / NBRC 105701 / NCIMB 13365 / CIP 78.65) TaxID=745277 RepID=H2J220_RAHAC|nr:alpha/beta hydrolase [Rahnella aquatilis]AEX54617.1 putative hydrolase or acyltransferase of alpha/beta superfamily [Rahnella aquatilis CIP 78.65 = ATCC 33071]KFD00216.1 HAD superfamily hydrolase [Rahnella aquatilis CIP 78.65 = ATCC 33071]
MTDITPSAVVSAAPFAVADLTLSGFTHRYATVDGVRLHYVSGGNPQGKVLLLLAGFPQTWYAWRNVMKALAEDFWLVAPDLPGQGDSDRPQTGYDTQSLAQKIHGLMQLLGHKRYSLAAHDVGAWVAYPYAAMYGGEVQRLALLDAGIPGITLPDALPVTPDKSWKTWHFAFHTLPDLPEALIAGNERVYLDWFLRRKTAAPDAFTDDDISEYLRVFLKSGGLRAGLAYYRSVTESAEQNRELNRRGKLKMPVLAVSADQGSIPDMAIPLHAFAENVTGIIIPHSGHFIPDEQPEALARELHNFFTM